MRCTECTRFTGHPIDHSVIESEIHMLLPRINLMQHAGHKLTVEYITNEHRQE